MKTIKELEQKINNITTKIHEQFPELNKYLLEMPQYNSENEVVNIKNLTEYYLSLDDIVSKYSKTHKAKTDYADLHIYPSSEDIYEKFKEETDINPEDISKKKTPNEEINTSNEKSFNEDMFGSDLDVPGSELDDQQESVGSEDEENNYYSLGGDNHNDLEEDKD